ncbi:hypothetical protein, partial [Chitinivorax sp. B]|uniref:hypothetical protein n=1 Tax=Chitinivorax sp. B TaxID=2502235 RepID=UPI001484CB98
SGVGSAASGVFYDGLIGGLGRWLSGDEHWNLGGQLYDWTHRDKQMVDDASRKLGVRSPSSQYKP